MDIKMNYTRVKYTVNNLEMIVKILLLGIIIFTAGS